MNQICCKELICHKILNSKDFMDAKSLETHLVFVYLLPGFKSINYANLMMSILHGGGYA